MKTNILFDRLRDEIDPRDILDELIDFLDEGSLQEFCEHLCENFNIDEDCLNDYGYRYDDED